MRIFLLILASIAYARPRSRWARAINRLIREGDVDDVVCPELFTSPENRRDEFNIMSASPSTKETSDERFKKIGERIAEKLEGPDKVLSDGAMSLLGLTREAVANTQLGPLVMIRALSVARSVEAICASRKQGLTDVNLKKRNRPVTDTYSLRVWQAWYWTLPSQRASLIYQMKGAVKEACRSVLKYPNNVAENLVPLLMDYKLSGIEGSEIVAGDTYHVNLLASQVIKRCEDHRTEFYDRDSSYSTF
jgi:hypothetical protein